MLVLGFAVPAFWVKAPALSLRFQGSPMNRPDEGQQVKDARQASTD